MPDLPECINSPVKDNLFIVGAAMSSGVRKYCDWLNPDHPDYNPQVVQDYLEMSLNLMADKTPIKDDIYENRVSSWVQTELDRLLREGNVQRPIIHRKPGKWFGFPEQEREAPKPMALISNEEQHARVYEGARDCPHRKQKDSCCGKVDICGEGGVKPGMIVTIGNCYPCTAERLGIEVK